ncbi:OPT oligopeptide transporter protein-domain-containing protein [Apiospora hydei]|uniref:OPT oligopeptide transporter protein-domain-containing protein n=1 Tax=Apiospora hydei TaxID=1337664 RepID=A0ABR1X7Q8_9PEZI
MASVIEKAEPAMPPASSDGGSLNREISDEKKRGDSINKSLDVAIEHEFAITDEDYAQAKAVADQMSLSEVKALMENVIKMHDRDPNFPMTVIEKIRQFLRNDAIFQHPEQHEELVYEMKLEAALITNNSPYAEVRSVVSNRDDPEMPCGTIRAWVIGLCFAAVLGFINQFFSVRQPAIQLMANVAQLLSFPLGKAWERFMPHATVFGLPLNPGHFSKKEHMLITIMANVGYQAPYTANIIWVQKLPGYYNQAWAGNFGYQILLALGTNFIGYGMAGIARRFLVYPSYCVWPASLVTIALNQSFHTEGNSAVKGWFNKVYTMSRYKYFLLAFGGMFLYYWFPYYIFQALSIFSWMTWIAPDNVSLAAITGWNNGLGLNPVSTFDWNTLTAYDGTDPLMVPFFSTCNKVVGSLLAVPVVAAIWYSNAWNTGYLPINSNRVYDNTGARYNVSAITDSHGMLDVEKYRAYSPAYMAAGNLVIYIAFFAIYTASLTYIALNHWFEVKMGFKNLFNSFRRTKNQQGGEAGGEYTDVHNRLMRRYPEVPEWWYAVCLVIAIAFGVAGVAAYPTETTPGVVFYGLVLCLIFIIPVGIIKSMTGIEVTLNVLAEFIGGAFVPGNATSLNFFKSFGYVTYPAATNLLGADVRDARVDVRVHRDPQLPDVPARRLHARRALPLHLPGHQHFFTASVLWGTIGPHRVFGAGGTYMATLVGWPLGIVLALAMYGLQRLFPRSSFLRQMHPVALLYGAMFLAPYNVGYLLPCLPIAYFSWVYTKKRYLAFWSKYNFVTSAAFSVGVALTGLVCFFSLQYTGVELKWWGNEVIYQGCEETACTLYQVPEGGHFGPGVGQFF